jgi:hypothetical protein
MKKMVLPDKISQKRFFNPLAKSVLAESVAGALLSTAPCSLGGFAAFDGAGIYVLYYTGKHPAYQTLVAKNVHDRFEAPIYVGKAVPAGARKGNREGDATQGKALAGRLRNHLKSIHCVDDLEDDAFYFRCLILDELWIPLGESLLIRRYQPVWNLLLDGFGNNPLGSGRTNQKPSKWDIFHPGRKRGTSALSTPAESASLMRDVKAFLKRSKPA